MGFKRETKYIYTLANISYKIKLDKWKIKLDPFDRNRTIIFYENKTP